MRYAFENGSMHLYVFLPLSFSYKTSFPDFKEHSFSERGCCMQHPPILKRKHAFTDLRTQQSTARPSHSQTAH